MNRLIKAEWYRARKSSGLIKWLFVVILIILAVTLLDASFIDDNSATSFFMEFVLNTSPFISLFFSVLAATFVGIPYNNKTGLYEVMAGNKISSIILSKLVVVAPVITFAFTAIFAAVIGVFYGMGGQGALGQLPLRIILLVVITFHVTTTGVLMTTATRSPVGIVLAFLRFAVFDSAISIWVNMLMQDHTSEQIDKAINWFVTSHIMKLGVETIPTYLIVEIIASTIIECTVWYVISYIGFKKKKFA